MSERDAAVGSPDDDAVVVVIPTYNERENLPSLVAEILALGDRYRILVVDDNSPDGTGALADELTQQYAGRVEVLHRPGKQGLGRAYVAGLTHALEMGPALIAQMDADHSHRPVDLAKMVAAAEQADLVLGSRYIPGGNTVGWPRYRKLISRAGGIYAGLVLGMHIRDLTGGFKVWRPEALRAIELSSIHSDGYGFQIETTFRANQKGYRLVQVPITFTDRIAGKSKLSRRIILEAVTMVWRLRLRQLLKRDW